MSNPIKQFFINHDTIILYMPSQFSLQSDQKITASQLESSSRLVASLEQGNRIQTLLGVTGSGKTFTMASIVEELQKPSLVLAPNKILAAQLYQEFREYFPLNAVEYFVSYYDYYRPEAYLPASDTLLEKESKRNAEIERHRHAATNSLLTRQDVLVVASVSAIYGLGDPHSYKEQLLNITVNQEIELADLIAQLDQRQFTQQQALSDFASFRVLGDIIEILSANGQQRFRIEFWGSQVETIAELDYRSGQFIQNLDHIVLFPASHYIPDQAKLKLGISKLKEEMIEQEAWFKSQEKNIEAQRVRERVSRDLELLEETGYCPGIENYAPVLEQRMKDVRPSCLLDYFDDDYLIFADESHISLSQIKGMFKGDQSRKQTLVDYGFRLPSSLGNRPLKWEEFLECCRQLIAVSATPGQWEKDHSTVITEQLIRPTGLLDPLIEVQPSKYQIDHLLSEIKTSIERDNRVLITTLSKKQAEILTQWLVEHGTNARYLHSEIDTLERIEIIRDLRLGKFQVLVGVNLLREGLDLPEVDLVAILDADAQGFLRGENALMQTIGRAARNLDGRVVMYAQQHSQAMNKAIQETKRRRKIQAAYNKRYGIQPSSIIKAIKDWKPGEKASKTTSTESKQKQPVPKITQYEPTKVLEDAPVQESDLKAWIVQIEQDMFKAATDLRFEEAARLRDQLDSLKQKL